VESVAFGITHLANLLAGGSHIKARARHHRQIEDKISIHTDEKAFYRSILTRFLIEHEPLSQELWTTLCPTLRALAAALGGGDANSTVADPFLAWPQSPKASVLPIPSDVNAPSPNVYRVSDGGASVDIRLSSIHIAKGQTHLATLILETYNHKHVLNSLMPWLLGNHQNGTKCTSDQAAQRLYQTYVAMTRPTHLLCLAMRNSSLGTGNAFATNQAQLIDRGWKIRHLTSAQAVKTNGYAPAIFP
jgi:DNA helicase-2/ATP-dependent DNA helicase PcrA